MRAQVAPGALSVNRISEGAAGLAVAAFLLHSAAKDLGGSGALLAFLFQVLPVHYAIMPWLVLLSVAQSRAVDFYERVPRLRWQGGRSRCKRQ
jgi:hypothetical protein